MLINFIYVNHISKKQWHFFLMVNSKSKGSTVLMALQLHRLKFLVVAFQFLPFLLFIPSLQAIWWTHWPLNMTAGCCFILICSFIDFSSILECLSHCSLPVLQCQLKSYNKTLHPQTYSSFSIISVDDNIIQLFQSLFSPLPLSSAQSPVKF